MAYRMTDRRMEKAQPILDTYRGRWVKSGFYDVQQFENEIKQTLDLHYKQAQDVLVDLLKNQRYQLMVLYYMQHHNVPGPPSEFKRHLAKAYGLKIYDCSEREEAQNSFWKRFSTAKLRERGLDADG